VLEQRSQSQTAFLVHIEYTDSRSANGSKTDNRNVGQTKMLFPGVLTRVEKRSDLSGFGIYTCEIRTLVRVASVASQREVCGIVIAAMLAGNDVLDLKRC
jgi:hypothetical protein